MILNCVSLKKNLINFSSQKDIKDKRQNRQTEKTKKKRESLNNFAIRNFIEMDVLVFIHFYTFIFKTDFKKN